MFLGSGVSKKNVAFNSKTSTHPLLDLDPACDGYKSNLVAIFQFGPEWRNVLFLFLQS
jgi:hypothetical protein